MTPVWLIEGTRAPDALAERRLAELRFSALAAAVREHEASARRRRQPTRPQDSELYSRLRRISEEPGAGGPG